MTCGLILSVSMFLHGCVLVCVGGRVGGCITIDLCLETWLAVFHASALLHSVSGGSTLYIETVLKKPYDPKASTQETGSLEMTGNLGSVMKESVQLAYTFAKAFMAKYYPDNLFLQQASLHLHVPEVGWGSCKVCTHCGLCPSLCG